MSLTDKYIRCIGCPVSRCKAKEVEANQRPHMPNPWICHVDSVQSMVHWLRIWFGGEM